MADSRPPVYQTLPDEAFVETNIAQISKCDNQKFITNFFEQHIPAFRLRNNQVLQDMKNKYFTVERRVKEKPKIKIDCVKRVSAKQVRKLKLYQLSKSVKYSDFQPLNDLWKSYFQSVFQPNNPDSNAFMIMRADFHGSILSVVKSRCPPYIGLEGIVAKETKNTFELVTKDDQLKTIPKANSVFQLIFKDYKVLLYGNQLCRSPSERVGKKFKLAGSTEL